MRRDDPRPPHEAGLIVMLFAAPDRTDGKCDADVVLQQTDDLDPAAVVATLRDLADVIDHGRTLAAASRN